MQQVGCIILGGGQGTRLFPLTMQRCKPAVPFGGSYCLIDVPISNALHANIEQIFVITQYLSTSLHRHICQTYKFDSFGAGFVDLIAASEGPGAGWFQGTADAIRKNSQFFAEIPVDYYLILSGDQLYTMDFQEMFRQFLDKDADLAIATLPVGSEAAKRMGILKTDCDGWITDFIEKPTDTSVLQEFKTSYHVKEGAEEAYLASMGIYLFKKQVLLDLLQEDTREDFGRHLIPTIVERGRSAIHLYKGFWEDIGTIETFYQANMAFTKSDPLFDFYKNNKRIYSQNNCLPGAKVHKAYIDESILCEGTIIEAKEVSGSIIGPQCSIGKNTIIRDSYIMGDEISRTSHQNRILTIGEHCHIEKAILDHNVRIGSHVTLTNLKKLNHYDSSYAYIRDGVIIIPRGVTLPDHFTL